MVNYDCNVKDQFGPLDKRTNTLKPEADLTDKNHR